MRAIAKLVLFSLAIGVPVAACGGGGGHGGNHDAGDGAAPDTGDGPARDAGPADAASDIAIEGGPLQINVTTHFCPVVFPVATPSEAEIGEVIAVSATVNSPDVGGLTFVWTSAAGTFATPSASSTTYLCQRSGEQILTATISDGHCSGEATVPVICH